MPVEPKSYESIGAVGLVDMIDKYGSPCGLSWEMCRDGKVRYRERKGEGAIGVWVSEQYVRRRLDRELMGEEIVDFFDECDPIRQWMREEEGPDIPRRNGY